MHANVWSLTWEKLVNQWCQLAPRIALAMDCASRGIASATKATLAQIAPLLCLCALTTALVTGFVITARVCVSQTSLVKTAPWQTLIA